MLRIVFLVSLLSFSFINVFSQTLDWEFASRSESGNFVPHIAVGSKGAAYFASEFKDSSYVLGDAMNTIPSNVHIYKVNSAGNKVWRRDILTTNFNVYTTDICIDKQENIYIIGLTNADELSFEGQMIQLNDSLSNVFLCKMDSSGNLVYFKSFPADYGMMLDIKVDRDFNIFATGIFSKLIILGDTTLSTPFDSINYRIDSFLAKFDSSVTLVSASVLNGTYSNTGLFAISNIDIDSSGNIYTGGTFRDSIKVGGQWINGNSSTILICKYSEDFNLIWTRTSQNGACRLADFKLDKTDGIYLSGNFYNSCSFDTITLAVYGLFYSDAFLVKYDTSGSSLWAKTVKSSQYVSNGLTVDITPDNDVFWGGIHPDSSIIGDSLLIYPRNDYYRPNGFICKLSSSGSIQKIFTLDSQYSAYPRDIYVTANDSIYILGTYVSDLVLSDVVLENTSANNGEFFLMKLSTEIMHVASVKVIQDINVSVFPNPTSGLSKIVFESDVKALVKIRNLTGQILSEISIFGDTGIIDLSAFANGLYIVEVLNENKYQRLKLLKN